MNRAVGIGGAEGLQPHQYFRITVLKGVCSPIDIQELLQSSPTNILDLPTALDWQDE